jgi:hypothetical protein
MAICWIPVFTGTTGEDFRFEYCHSLAWAGGLMNHQEILSAALEYLVLQVLR